MSSPDLEIRKTPRQERARLTVEALLEATEQLLVDVGYANMTTNGIAQRAGVSIGSLYQYFPNKEAIIVELSRRYAEDQVATLIEALAVNAVGPIEANIGVFVRSLLELRRLKPDLFRVLYTEVPRLG